MPGVRDVGVGSFTPVWVREPTRRLELDGWDAPANAQPWAAFAAVGDGYLEALSIPLVAGRTLTAQDIRDQRPVVVINQAMVDQHWGEERPLGRRLRVGDEDTEWLTIVGIVGNIRNSDREQAPLPYTYVPYTPRGRYKHDVLRPNRRGTDGVGARGPSGRLERPMPTNRSTRSSRWSRCCSMTILPVWCCSVS